jgi:AcrR family transcriptional regulator
MSNRAGSPRRYDSPRRREQASATRQAILDAARALFAERGYVGTTIEAIAAYAAVSPETVYATFRNKRSLLSALVDISIVGDDEPVPVLDRDWVRQIRDEPDQRRRLELLARNGRLILERRAPIDEVVRSAAAADPEIAALHGTGKTQRIAGQRELLRVIAGADGLRAGLPLDEAADILFAVGSPEVYRLLVIDRGWSPERFEAWYVDTIERLLLR